MTTSHTGGRRPVFRWIVLAIVLLVIASAILLPLVNMSRYHRTIAESLSRSLGRPVHLGSVQLQVFPRPGLALTDFEVEETPVFGTEPILHAPSVLVSLRLSSLWRGRLEASRIDLDSASMNLAHNAQGDWNIGSLLLEASRTPQAPTGQRHASEALRFPYIDFHSARINLKDGNQKKPFSFLNADLSIWLDKPTQWSLHLEAQPARTDLDLDLSDAGIIKVDGTINRATSFNQMPVNLRAEWTGAQIGQVSRLLLGDDSGWRGDLRAEATLSGLLDALNVQTRVRVDGVHREEFTPDTPMNIDMRCRAVYRHGERSLDDMTCLQPTGDGHLLLTGNVTNFTHPQSQLSLELNQVSATFAVSALGLLHRGLTILPKATGLVNGSFSAATGSAPATVTGHAKVTGLTLALASVETPFRFPTLELGTPAPAPAPAKGRKKSAPAPAPPALSEFTIQLQPAALDLGAPKPLVLSGQLDRGGFSIHASGQSSLTRLSAFGRLMGHAGSALTNLAPDTPAISAPAPAEMDLTFTAPWVAPLNPDMNPDEPETSSATLGWLRLSHAQAKPAWLPAPIHIATATANFTPGTIAWSNLSFAVNAIAARGSLSYPLQCSPGATCAASFTLDVPVADAAQLQATLLGTGGHGELVNAILSEVQQPTAAWPAAEGTVTIDKLTLSKLPVTNVRGTLSLRLNQIRLSLDAATLGGSLHAAGLAAMTSGNPKYALNLIWTNLDPAKAGSLFEEKWGSGSLSGDAQLTIAGLSASDLAHSAHGSFHWAWANGSLGANTPKSPESDKLAFSPRHFAQWSAAGTISSDALHLSNADGVHGQIGFDRSLDLSWPTENGRLHIEGSLNEPSVTLEK